MDFLLAIIPTQVIRTLTRPMWEKLLISCLMAMGLLATGIAIYTMTIGFASSGDPLRAEIIQDLRCKLEEQVGIVGACMSCLKGPAERLLRRMGIIGNKVDPLPSFVISLRGMPSGPAVDLENTTRHESGVSLTNFSQTNSNSGAASATKSTAASSNTKEV